MSCGSQTLTAELLLLQQIADISLSCLEPTPTRHRALFDIELQAVVQVAENDEWKADPK
jgi:hypothetical protein